MPEKWQSTAGGEGISLDRLNDVSRELFAFAGNRTVWLFHGEMGSGKTTLIKAVCVVAGVRENMSSPTFSLVNEYRTDNGDAIYHFDLYRLKNEKEVIDIGAEEYFDSGSLCLVEWPEKLGSLVPVDAFHIRIIPTATHLRKIEFQRV